MTPIISALRRLRQEDSKLQHELSEILSSKKGGGGLAVAVCLPYKLAQGPDFDSQYEKKERKGRIQKHICIVIPATQKYDVSDERKHKGNPKN